MTQDLQLIEKAQKGDRAAFEQLLRQHYDMMFRVAYRYTGQQQDAQDIAQEVAVALVHKISAFRGESSFSTWLYRVVVNSCRDLQKKQGSQARTHSGYIEVEKNAAAEDVDNAKRRAWLYRQLATLEDSLRETALLVLSEQLSHAEAAKILSCAESTISWRMHEIRKQLKAAMDSYHD